MNNKAFSSHFWVNLDIQSKYSSTVVFVVVDVNIRVFKCARISAVVALQQQMSIEAGIYEFSFKAHNAANDSGCALYKVQLWKSWHMYAGGSSLVIPVFADALEPNGGVPAASNL